MSPTEQTTKVIRAWAEVFIHRSLRDFRRFLSETGLSHAQFGILMRLYHNGPCGVSHVGEQLGVSRAAASQAVERLVQLGLITRTEDPKDRRVRRLTLTEKGRALSEAGIAARTRWLEELADALTPEQQEAITQALALLTQIAQTND